MLLVTLALLSAAPAAASAPPVASTRNDRVTIAAADPAKLAVAARIAAKLLPDGSYRTIMGGVLATVQQGMLQQMTALPVRAFIKAAGIPDGKVGTLGTGTIREAMTIIDPVFDERLRLTTAAMNTAMIAQMSKMEPTIREGMAIAYANRFSAAQLADVDAFFASPSGTAYAAGAWQIMSDPAVAARNQTMMKTMAAAIPAAMRTASDAAAALPAPRKPADLSPADRSKLASLLGVDAAALK